MLLASLVEPAFGLIFWMTLSFGIVFFLLAKFAWKPILKALHEREQLH
jgi:F-type H+-transporting ATPase subunit b